MVNLVHCVKLLVALLCTPFQAFNCSNCRSARFQYFSRRMVSCGAFQ